MPARSFRTRSVISIGLYHHASSALIATFSCRASEGAINKTVGFLWPSFKLYVLSVKTA